MSAADVLHSWAVPSLGIKCDAISWTIKSNLSFYKREGLYYGQCSEICGINHGFMPIVVEAIPLKNYITWISDKVNE